MSCKAVGSRPSATTALAPAARSSEGSGGATSGDGSNPLPRSSVSPCLDEGSALSPFHRGELFMRVSTIVSRHPQLYRKVWG